MNTHSKLKRFGIYHPKEGKLNIACEIDGHDYEYVTSVEAQALVQVMYRTQNDFNKEYAALGKRSTSVGDIVTAEDRVYMIHGVGYKRIPKTKELYKKIMDTDEAVIETLSRHTLTDRDMDNLIDNSY